MQKQWQDTPSPKNDLERTLQRPLQRARDISGSIEYVTDQLQSVLYRLDAGKLDRIKMREFIAHNLSAQADALQSLQDLNDCLLDPAAEIKLQLEWIDKLSDEMFGSVQRFKEKARSFDIDLDIKFYTRLPRVKWDMNRIRSQVFNHVISSAIDSTPVGGCLTFCVYATETHVVMGFKDTFHYTNMINHSNVVYSTHFVQPNPALSSAESCVEAHNGTMKISKVDERGAWYLIEMPIDASAS